LLEERRTGDLVRGLIRQGHVTAVHDVSDGGPLVAVAEMALASDIGVTLVSDGGGDDIPDHAFWFGEDQARYVVTVAPAQAGALYEAARDAGILARRLGDVGGDAIAIGDAEQINLSKLRTAHEGWFPNYMGG
jgi:phosphoribosylformylglycinamidine synthase